MHYVSFSPIDTQHIVSRSSTRILWWNINGYQVPPKYSGSHIAFSLDHTQFAVCNGKVVTVYQVSDSRIIGAKSCVAEEEPEHCCFSPDGKLIAAATYGTAYVWNITSPNPHLIETFPCHTQKITSLVFSSPSSLISASDDELVRFWKIGILSTDLAMADSGSTPFISPSIMSVSLQARAGIAISSDKDGVVKSWDISTGHCKTSF